MKTLIHRRLATAVLLSGVMIFSFSCKSYDDIAAHYSSKHIKDNTGKVIAQVPETNELAYIVYSLTDVSLTDTAFIDRSSAYYKDVIKQFAAFKNHKAVKQLNKDVARDTKNLLRFRNGIYAFTLNERNDLALKLDYRTDLNRIDFRRYAPLLEDFAEKTNFRSFYTQHKGLYNQIILDAGKTLSVDDAWASVGKDYKEPFNSYQLILSPLIKGKSSTLAIKGSNFRECLIFAQSSSMAFR
jgi:hypothetical protein